VPYALGEGFWPHQKAYHHIAFPREIEKVPGVAGHPFALQQLQDQLFLRAKAGKAQNGTPTPLRRQELKEGIGSHKAAQELEVFPDPLSYGLVHRPSPVQDFP
jgi:hypothetical protein